MATPYAYFKREIVPLEEAKIGVMTHAFNYGTAVFEGIRGNWNEEEGQIYVFRIKEHFDRLRKSCRIMQIDFPYDNEELSSITTRLVEMSGYREDVYIRPLAYKSSEILGVRLHDLDDDLLIFVAPFGPYLDIEKGARCQTSSWRRVADTGIPARAKITGIYANSALAKTEAQLNGFDEAIMLDERGHISEGSGENIFVVQDGQVITPPPSSDILVGITRDTVMTLVREELGLPVVERDIDRSEVYTSDECFMTGTAAHVTPVVELDRRPIGDGKMGPVTARLVKLYFEIITGRHPKYARWCTPCFSKVKA
ncbi:MAG TPA: branched-chain amino acid transaminase [Dehalococcoidia bacterium]|jgi:branched-chain amino acid aminotransferase|nr:branched-chain amino acid transaminase [Dehalococcoidia bacterium]